MKIARNIISRSALLFFTLFGIISCGGEKPASGSNEELSSAVINVDAVKFKELIEASPTKNIIDVRTDGEVAIGVIENAKQIDLSNPDFEGAISKLDKSEPVFVYCAVGGRSSRASEVFKNSGFEKVYNLEGGINAWQSNGFPISELK